MAPHCWKIHSLLQLIVLFFVLLVFAETVRAACPVCSAVTWGNWGACSVTCGSGGKRFRTKKCGPTCKEEVQPEEGCNLVCCPKDCTYGPWSSGSNCICYDDNGKQFEQWMCSRFRASTASAKCNGKCILFERVQNGTLCCKKNCVITQWTSFFPCEGQCEQKGIQRRFRKITQQPACRGTECPKDLVEQKACVGACCPIGCVIGAWRAWSTCNTGCGEGTRRRTRGFTDPVCNGKACPPLSDSLETEKCEKYDNFDCTVSSFGAWSICVLMNGKCGAGTKTRTRTVVQNKVCRGKECPPLTETLACSGLCCVTDCVVNDWQKWGPCSAKCGPGRSERKRTVKVEQACKGKACPVLLESKTCKESVKKACVMSKWGPWAECTSTCGTGTQQSTRTVAIPAYCDGECPDQNKLVQTQSCDRFMNTDCKVSDYGKWTTCLRSCTGGSRQRERTITVQPKCQGAKCPKLQEVDNKCHSLCTANQVCSSPNAVCSCKPNYKPNAAGNDCDQIVCPNKYPSYCPPGIRGPPKCYAAEFTCNARPSVPGSTCKAECFTGKLKSINPEDKKTYSIKCEPDGKWSAHTIFCGPTNKPPTDITVNKLKISESEKVKTCFATIKVVAPDTDKHTITVSANPHNRLYIDKASLCLNVKPDYEDAKTWTFKLKAVDYENLSFEKEFTLVIENVNEAPKNLKIIPNSLKENSPKGTVIGHLTAYDDESAKILITMLDTYHGLFEPFSDPKTGKLMLRVAKDPQCQYLSKNCMLDFEKKPVLTVIAKAHDEQGLFTIKDVPIQLTDVDDKQLSISMEKSEIPETTKVGEPFDTIKTIDQDKDQKYKYEIVEDKNGVFKMINNRLTITRTFDFEKDGALQFEAKVRSTELENKKYSIEDTITLTVIDVNEIPFELTLVSIGGQLDFQPNKPMIRENSATGTAIGEITIKDQDKTETMTGTLEGLGNTPKIEITKPFSCSLVKGSSYCKATLGVAGSLDFETMSEIKFTIVAKDKGGLTQKLPLTLIIVDINEAPTDVLANGKVTDVLEIAENANDALVATLKGVDQDKQSQFKYFVSTNVGGKFKILEGSDKLKTSAQANLDYESVKEYNIAVTVMDNGSPPIAFIKKFTIKVLDANEIPTKAILSTSEVTENSAEGTEIATLTAKDPDNEKTAVQTFAFSMADTGNAKGRFKIVGDKLQVTKSTLQCGTSPCSLNYEKDKMHPIKVKVVDSGKPAMSATFTLEIVVKDTNDRPTDTALSGFIVYENAKAGTEIGVVSAKDEDVSQTLTFKVAQGQNLVTLTNNKLSTAKVFNFEETPQFTVDLVAEDNGTPALSQSKSFVITVKNVNESPVCPTLADVTVEENKAPGTVIGTIEVTDGDNSETITFEQDNFKDVFGMTAPKCVKTAPSGTKCSVSINLVKSLDYEKKNSYEMTVRAKDAGGLECSMKVKVIVKDMNDNPTDILVAGDSKSTFRVTEGSTPDTVVQLSTTDQDPKDKHTYKIKEAAMARFGTIVGTTIKIIGSALDYETKKEMDFHISSTDQGGLTFEKAFKLIVLDANDQPTSLELSNKEVAENSPADTVIGVLSGKDPDAGQTLVFSLPDSADGRFKIDGNQLKVAESNVDCLKFGGDRCRLNFEKIPKYTVKVTVTDSGQPPKSKDANFVINLTGVNEAPRHLKLVGREVRENAPINHVIGKLSVVDEETTQTHTYAFTSGNDGNLFKINGASLVKATADKLDVTKTYKLTVEAVDSGTPPKKVSRVFDLPVLKSGKILKSAVFTKEGGSGKFENDKATVKENSALGTVVGTLEYTLFPGTKDVSVLLVDDGTPMFQLGTVSSLQTDNKVKVPIKVADSINFEEKKSFSILTKLTSKFGADSQEFTIAVENVNEKPLEITSSMVPLSVEENFSGVIASFGTKDPDKGDTHTYVLSGEGAGTFVVTNPKGELKTAPGAKLDYETKNSYTIKVKSTDSGGLSIEKEFTVKVTDLNEKATGLTLSNSKVAENVAVDTLVGLLKGTDPDNANMKRQTLTFDMVDNAGGRFKIKDGDKVMVAAPNTGCLDRTSKVKCLLDFETKTSHNIIVKVTDDGKPTSASAELPLTIEVTDVNEDPYAVLLSNDKVSESAAVGAVVGSPSASDQDQGQTLTFTVTGPAADVLTVTNGEVVLKKKVDYETQNSYKGTLVATDNGNPKKSATAEFTVSVQDVKEAPSSMTWKASGQASSDLLVGKISVKENTALRTVVAKLAIKDTDKDDKINLKLDCTVISAGAPKCVTVTQLGVGMTSCEADIEVNEALDYEIKKEYTCKITATDSSGLDIVKTFLLVLSDENDTPKAIIVNNDPKISELTVAENSKGVEIATLTTLDDDVNQAHTYSIVKGKTNANSDDFTVAANGKLMVSSLANLDFENTPTSGIPLKLRSSDGTLSVDKDIVIVVTDVNELPTKLSLSANQVKENAPAGTEIGAVAVIDPDNSKTTSQTFTLRLADSLLQRFEIKGVKLKVGAKPSFDFEKGPKTYALSIGVTDSGKGAKEVLFSVTVVVTDANDVPTTLTLVGNSIREDAAPGAQVGILSAVDPDAGQSLKYTVENNDKIPFGVNKNALVVDGPLDYELEGTVQVKVIAVDNGVPPLSVSNTFTITVTNVNEPLRYVKFYLSSWTESDFMVEEGLEVGAKVGYVEVADPDKDETITAVISTVTDGVLKMGTAGTCKRTDVKYETTKCVFDIVMAKKIIFQTEKPTYTVKATATSTGSVLSRSATFKIKNKNHPPTDVKSDSNTVREGAVGDDAQIGALSTDDLDTEDKHTLVLVSGAKYMEIVDVNGKPFLKAKDGAVDFETTETIPVRVRSTDNGKPPLSVEKTITVTVINVNEKPSVSKLTNNEVSLTAAVDTIIGRVIVDDPDNKNKEVQKHTCSIGEGANVFKMDTSTNTIKLAAQLQKIATYDVEVTCTDDGKPQLQSVMKSFKIYVKQSADVPKLLLLDGKHSVEENKAGAVIGQFSVLNELTGSVLGVAITYKLKSNADKFAVSGLKLETKVALDFEAEDIWPIEVEATGNFVNKAFTITKTFKISVIDLNESPTVIKFDMPHPVPENSPVGTKIGTLMTTDQDKGQTFTYTIEAVDKGKKANVAAVTGDASLLALFKIQGADIQVGGNINFESGSEYSLKVKVADSGTPVKTLKGLVLITVADMKEAPSAIEPSTLTVAENSPEGTVLKKLTVTDEDIGDTHVCTISKVGQPPDFPFAIKESSVVFVNVASIDYEKKQQYTLDVICKDKATLTLLKVITVTVTNVNEKPYEVKLSVDSVPEDTPKGGTAATILAKDHESSKITFKVTSADGVFVLKGANTLVTTAALDFEKKSSYKVTVTATDDGGLSTDADIDLQIGNVNEAPTDITFNAKSVEEGTAAGTAIGTLVVKDDDKGQTHTCVIAAGAPLTVVQKVKVEVSGKIDYETTDVLKFSVTCTDDGVPAKSLTKEISLPVVNVNDPPTSLTINPPNPVLENAAADTVVTKLTVVDPDVGKTITCNVIPANAPFNVVEVDKVKHIFNLFVTQALDFEIAPKYDLKVKCSDDGGYSIEQSTTIMISNVNEAPTDIIMKNIAPIASTASAGYPISKLVATDHESVQIHTFTVEAPASAYTTMKSDVLTLTKAIPQDILKMTNPKLSIKVKVEDNGVPLKSFTKVLSIPITITDKKPLISISTETVLENAAVGSSVATFELKNMREDKGGYEVTLIDTGSPFKIDGTNLVLKSALSYNIRNAYTIKVSVFYKKYNFAVIKTDFNLLVKQTNICTPKCKANAQCIIKAGSPNKCKCIDGYIMAASKDGTCKNEDDCKKNSQPCKNGGTCVDGVAQYTCKCPTGYDGDNCEVMTKPPKVCTPNPCKNGGLCVPKGSGYQCDCKTGFEGKTCETNIDDCAGKEKKCLSGGVCKDLVNDYECSCQKNKIGCDCEFDKTVCDATKCPGQTCVPKYNKAGHLCAKKEAKNVIKISKGVLNVATVQQKICKNMRSVVKQMFTRLDSIPPKRKRAAIPSIRVYTVKLDSSATNGNAVLSYVVFNDNGKIYNESQVVAAMKIACDKGEVEKESLLCPAIIQRDKEINAPKKEDKGINMLYVYIGAGAGGGLLLIIVIIVVVAVCVKKNSNQSEGKIG